MADSTGLELSQSDLERLSDTLRRKVLSVMERARLDAEYAEACKREREKLDVALMEVTLRKVIQEERKKSEKWYDALKRSLKQFLSLIE